MHEDEIEIADDLVRALVDRQLPRFAKHELRRLPESGSTNVLFRLGDDLLVRLPRQRGGSESIEKEARYLPLFASSISVALPRIVAVGEPALGYPERWSVVRWIAGQRPAVPIPDGAEGARFALDLATALRQLHAAPVPSSASGDPGVYWYRAGPLRAIDPDIRQDLAACRAVTELPLDLERCERFWHAAMSIPDAPADRPPRWVHCDLLAENLLVRNGRLAAVLDFGTLALGDPSVDLIAGWELLEPRARDIFRSAVGVPEDVWARGRAWAFAIAVMTFPYYWRTMPARCADRLVMARAVLDDDAADP